MNDDELIRKLVSENFKLKERIAKVRRENKSLKHCNLLRTEKILELVEEINELKNE